MMLSSNEIYLLQRRFELIEAYLSRNSLNFVNAIMVSTYFGNLNRGEANFNAYHTRTRLRNEKVAVLHNAARKIMLELNLDYDLQEVTIPDSSTGNRTVTFAHAQLVVFLFIIIHKI